MNHVLPVPAFSVETSARLQQVGVVFETLMLEQCLAPMARGNDAVAGYGISALAQSIAERDTHGFGPLLAAHMKAEQLQ